MEKVRDNNNKENKAKFYIKWNTMSLSVVIMVLVILFEQVIPKVTVPLVNLLTNIAVQNGIVSRYYHGPYPIMSHRKIQAVTHEYPERNRQGSRD